MGSGRSFSTTLDDAARWAARRAARRALRPALRALLGVVLLAALLPAQVRAPVDGAKPPTPDHCIVCDGPAGDDPIVETVDGRRVAVCRACGVESWNENRDALMAKLQARGALFDEHANVANREQGRSLMSGWMWFGTWALAGIVCAAATTYLALTKGLAPLPWLFAGLAFNVVALALVAMRRRGDLSRLPEGVPAGLAKIATTRAPSTCAKCGAQNHPSVSTCASCGAPMAARGESEVARLSRAAKDDRRNERRAQ